MVACRILCVYRIATINTMMMFCMWFAFGKFANFPTRRSIDLLARMLCYVALANTFFSWITKVFFTKHNSCCCCRRDYRPLHRSTSHSTSCSELSSPHTLSRGRIGDASSAVGDKGGTHFYPARMTAQRLQCGLESRNSVWRIRLLLSLCSRRRILWGVHACDSVYCIVLVV